ncbi:MAG TPA: ATP synthase F0 subunit B [Bryobacteraceae bacterium]|nr:ATP synthase F0 subunit B [Bryobacteraceae bacterium]
MRKLLPLLLLAVTVPFPGAAGPNRSVTVAALFAQEPAGEKAGDHPAEKPGEGEHGGLIAWKWVNFAVLALGIGWVVKKNAGPFFAARTLKIRKDMIEADDLRKQAEARAAEVDQRLANLEGEIAALRAESAREAEAETERLSRWTAAEIAKVQAHAEAEIASAGKAARMELKRYSAELAIRIAEQKIRARMTPEVQDSLVAGFMRHLEPPAQAQSS